MCICIYDFHCFSTCYNCRCRFLFGWLFLSPSLFVSSVYFFLLLCPDTLFYLHSFMWLFIPCGSFASTCRIGCFGKCIGIDGSEQMDSRNFIGKSIAIRFSTIIKHLRAKWDDPFCSQFNTHTHTRSERWLCFAMHLNQNKGQNKNWSGSIH